MINISHSSVFQQVCIFLDGFPSTREQMDDRQQTMNNGLDNGREYEQDCVAGTKTQDVQRSPAGQCHDNSVSVCDPHQTCK